MNNNKLFFLPYLITLLCLLQLTSCATVEGPPNPDDPLERYNRSMFQFNETLDTYALKPIAKGYNIVMPEFANAGVSNFFSNLDDIVVFINQILQFKITDALRTSARFVYNTTFGLAGFIDVATHMSLPKIKEDFGQTLAVWGVNSGPYFVLPLFGPSTIRDSAGLAVDLTYFDPVLSQLETNKALALSSINFIDTRADLMKTSNIIDDTIHDKYSFIRDAWLQRRNYLIYDGNPPSKEDEDDLFADEDLEIK